MCDNHKLNIFNYIIIYHYYVYGDNLLEFFTTGMYGSSFELYFDVAGIRYDLFINGLSMFHITNLSLITSVSFQQVFSFLSATFTWWFLLWKRLQEVCTLQPQRKQWNNILSTYSQASNSQSSNIKWDWKYYYYFIVDPNSLPSRNANLNSDMKYQLIYC